MLAVRVDLTRFTRIEGLIVTLLMDGQLHSSDQILAECFDETASAMNLRPHICSIRKKLAPAGLLISCVTNGRGKHTAAYQMRRNISNRE